MIGIGACLVMFMEAWKTSSWRKSFPMLIDAGVSTIEELLATPPETLKQLSIPPVPLERLIKLKQNLNQMRIQTNNCFLQPLHQNQIFDKFEFVPQFTYEQYLADIEMSDKTKEIEQAINKVIDVGPDPMTKQQQQLYSLLCIVKSHRTRVTRFIV
ncbi:unnamed protein product [Didymodactylos carnosus]|uniref:Uncharacterized protein n=2 Tax=Didymodactylos carnosus TaxID=1234261 RepID=A0A815A760_9BILA|nr:unnamed protein product [Didymodactylos carnosus]CAF4024429.1 unnamed protein product [Didymodactylos carnosus]